MNHPERKSVYFIAKIIEFELFFEDSFKGVRNLLYFIAANIKIRQVAQFVEFVGQIFDEVVRDVEGSELFELENGIVD